MILSSISETKNNLSRILEKVRQGETVIVMDRKRPVARIEPVQTAGAVGDEALTALIADGVVAQPREPLSADRILAMPLARSIKGLSAAAALLAEREESP